MSKLATHRKIVSWLVWGLGTGKIKFMPGTWGSLLGLLFVYLLSNFSKEVFLLTTVCVCLLSWWLISLYESWTHEHDESCVVIDEVAGIFVCFLGISNNWPILLAGFVLFRFFDILKPFPISWIDQKVPGAMGTLLDDLVAGGVVCVCLHLLLRGGWL